MDEPVDDPETDVVEPWIVAATWRRAVVSLLFTILPIVSFAASDGFLAPEWQDSTAEWSSVFANAARGPFETFLLALFGLGTTITVWRPDTRRHPFGRAVLAGAVVLSGFYAIALTAASGGATILMVVSLAPLAAIAGVIAYGLRALNDGASKADAGVALRLGAAALIAALITIVGPLQNFVLSIAAWTLFALLGSGPFLCCAVATRLLVSRWEARNPAELLPVAGAAAVAATSIYVTWQRAMEHYATLSPTDRYADCYIASAAAHGHPSIVGSWAARFGTGTVTVTNQLVDLKAVELLVRAASPRLHRWIRYGYDRIGPRLAARITSPVRADVAWVTMLPLGLAARLILLVMPAATRRRVDRLHPPANRRPATNR